MPSCSVRCVACSLWSTSAAVLGRGRSGPADLYWVLLLRAFPPAPQLVCVLDFPAYVPSTLALGYCQDCGVRLMKEKWRLSLGTLQFFVFWAGSCHQSQNQQ